MASRLTFSALLAAGLSAGDLLAAASSVCPSSEIYTQTAMPNDDVEQYVNFARTGDDIPEIFHGIFWMDQTGYYQTRPDRPDQAGEYETLPGQKEWFKTFPHNLKGAAAELLIGFGGTWNKTTGCARISPRSDHWSYVNTTGEPEIGSLNWQLGSTGFFQFCLDNSTGVVELMHQSCTLGEDIPKEFYVDLGRQLIPKPWGFERLNLAWQTSKHYNEPRIAQRYAVYQIVDGEGKRTPHYKAYSDFMKMRCWFTPGVNPKMAPHERDEECTSQGGLLINLGNGTQVIGKPAGRQSLLRRGGEPLSQGTGGRR